MKKTLIQLTTGLGATLFTIWTFLKYIVDWLGRGIAVHDTHEKGAEWINGILSWLLGTPSWVPGVLATLLTLALLYSLFKSQKSNHNPSNNGERFAPTIRNKSAAIKADGVTDLDVSNNTIIGFETALDVTNSHGVTTVSNKIIQQQGPSVDELISRAYFLKTAIETLKTSAEMPKEMFKKSFDWAGQNKIGGLGQASSYNRHCKEMRDWEFEITRLEQSLSLMLSRPVILLKKITLEEAMAGKVPHEKNFYDEEDLVPDFDRKIEWRKRYLQYQAVERELGNISNELKREHAKVDSILLAMGSHNRLFR